MVTTSSQMLSNAMNLAKVDMFITFRIEKDLAAHI